MKFSLLTATMLLVSYNTLLTFAFTSSNQYQNEKLPELAQRLSNNTLQKQPHCPANSTIRFKPVPFLLAVPAEQQQDLLRKCGGHVFSDSNLTLHDDGTGQPYLSSTVTFQHYSTETLCFTQVYEKENQIYQPDIWVMNMIEDIHTAPVSQVSNRLANLKPSFSEQYQWPKPSSKNEPYFLHQRENGRISS